jgi:hypothetical protein
MRKTRSLETSRLEKARHESVLANWDGKEGSVSAKDRCESAGEHIGGFPSLMAQTPHVRATSLHKVAMLGNHLPRQCGIATFTTDLRQAISDEFCALECFVLAMNDSGRRYVYPSRVRFETDSPDEGLFLNSF